MRIKTKKISVLYLTPAEVNQLLDMTNEAQQGHKVNYSERQTGPGAYFGIAIDAEKANPFYHEPATVEPVMNAKY